MSEPVFLTPAATLTHWQAHRRLTRKVIVAFPDDKLFSFSVGGMRPFGALALEMIGMTIPMVKGVVTKEWGQYSVADVKSKADILKRWDEDTAQLDALWARIPAADFAETITAFGQYTGKCFDLLLYVIDNEIHHRAQGYVYLRALGIEPPQFYDRT